MLYGRTAFIKKAFPAVVLALLCLPASASAQDGMLGEIRMFAGSFCPQGWAETDGRMMSVGDNQALFSLLGNYFGGDGRNNFALPDLRGRVPIGVGFGPGLSPYTLGQTGGSEQVALDVKEIPKHSHAIRTTTEAGEGSTSVAAGAKGDLGENTEAVLPSGMSKPHENRPPFQVVRYCICVDGVYPMRP